MAWAWEGRRGGESAFVSLVVELGGCGRWYASRVDRRLPVVRVRLLYHTNPSNLTTTPPLLDQLTDL